MGITEITGMGMPYNYRIKEAQAAAQNVSPDAEKQKPLENTRDMPDKGKTEEAGLRNGGLQNFSLTFNKDDTYDYIGSEKEPEKMDVEKAVSDMRRDSILQEYQYFVGGKPNLQYDGDIDGRFFIKK